MGDLQRLAAEVKTASGTETVTCSDCGRPFEALRGYVDFCNMPRAVPLLMTCPGCLEAERARAEAEQRIRAFDSAMKGFQGDRGTRLSTASFAAYREGPHNAQALAKATAWLEAEVKPNFLIVGPIASGKSYLAACLYNALLAAYQPAYWLNAGSLVATIRAGFGDREKAVEANQRMEQAEGAPILVLDDLGKVHPGKDVSWVEETFYNIVEARYRDELPTIVTTEWKSAALAERVGLSVVSRLEDGAWVAGVKAPAEPYRKVQPRCMEA